LLVKGDAIDRMPGRIEVTVDGADALVKVEDVGFHALELSRGGLRGNPRLPGTGTEGVGILLRPGRGGPGEELIERFHIGHGFLPHKW
jgi:hypothetical protein